MLFKVVCNVFSISSIHLFPSVGNIPNILTLLIFLPKLFINPISKFTFFPLSVFATCTICLSSLIPNIPSILYVLVLFIVTNPFGEDIPSSFSIIPASVVPPSYCVAFSFVYVITILSS